MAAKTCLLTGFTREGTPVVPQGTYSSDGVQRVLDRQQQNFVTTGRVVSIGRPGNPLAGGEVEEGSLIGHQDGLARHTALSIVHTVKLHQGLAFKRHHHHVAAKQSEGEGGA